MMAGAEGDQIDVLAKKLTEAGKVDVIEGKRLLTIMRNSSNLTSKL